MANALLNYVADLKQVHAWHSSKELSCTMYISPNAKLFHCVLNRQIGCARTRKNPAHFLKYNTSSPKVKWCSSRHVYIPTTKKRG